MTGRPAMGSLLRTLATDPFVAAYVAIVGIEVLLYGRRLGGEAFLQEFGRVQFLLAPLAVTVGGAWAGVGRIADREERRFWTAIAASCSAWFAAVVLYAAPIEIARWSRVLLVDTLYVSSYLPLLLAVEWRPHLGAAASAWDPDRWWHVVSATLAAAGLFVYLVALPAWFDQRFYGSSIPMYLLFLTLDFMLGALYFSVGRRCGVPRWRAFYWAVGAGSLAMGFADLLDLLNDSSVISWQSGAATDFLWLVPSAVYLAAVRLKRAWPVPEAAAVGQEPSFLPEERRRTGALVLIGAAVFPLLHLWLHANFVVDPGLKRAHAFLVLVMLALLGAVATAIYTWLGRRHEALAQASRRLEAQLREAQRLEAAGRLSGGVAHDFNNLLTTITGYNEMAIDRLPEGDPSRFALEEIRKASARASALTTQLLAFSRRQVLKPERISLNAIVEQVRPMLARLIGEDVTLQTRLAPDLGDVTADPVQIQSVLLTLAANARDAMAGGGTLTIGTADDSPRASVRLIVQDTGGGIPDELRPHVFEPFYAVGPRGAGLGLGLAAVHGIVTQSGGTVDVESGPGRGTTFVIRLPRAR